MITQWEIISNLNSDKSSTYYALLIDGAEQDARLIARKLHKYVKIPAPADAPYVYRFPLPPDLDEDTLEKIHQLVEEGIQQAKKVNELVPGGAFEVQLFTPNTDKEDKAFPTFITLDPSQSFFSVQAQEKSSRQAAPTPKVDHFEQKSIDLNQPDGELPAVVDTTMLRSIFQTERNPLKPAAEPETFRKEIDLSFAAWGTLPSSSDAVIAETVADVGAEATTPQQDTPADKRVANFVPESTISPTVAAEVFSTSISSAAAQANEQILSEVAEANSSENATPQPAVSQSAPEKKEQQPSTQTKTTPVPLSTPQAIPPQSLKPLNNIFLAATKYDMFVDVQQAAAKSGEKSATPQQSPAVIEKLPGSTAENFNVFDQKIKDQTCFIDVNDVTNVTEHLAQKDLSFVQHAQVQEQAPVSKETAPAQSVPTPARPASIAHIGQENQQSEEVMDPFEQLLSGTTDSNKSVTAAPASAPAPTQPPAQPTSIPLTSVPPASKKASKSNQASDFKKDTAVPTKLNKRVKQQSMEKKNMTENTGEKKPSFHLKRKEQVPPAPPAAPLSPKAPAVPQPQAPAAPAAPTVPEPEEEKHHTILRKKRLGAVPAADKTTTIDHSIQLPFSELQKHNWPLEVPLIPTHTLENMTISINRFAHATAISVIENPGKLYNPLVLHGSSGTGKTHFLHAIGYALSKKFGQENVFITNGVRLSRGIQRYIMEGNIKKFEDFTASVKALLIDDIHLISINEQNRAYLSKLLNDFRSQHKQIVITSKYPPENLAKLEELLNFKLDSGWISDLKQAKGSARMKIIQQMLISNGINITNDDAETFFGQANMSLGTVVRSIRRVRVLEKLMHPDTPPEDQSPLAIFNQLLAVGGEPANSLIATTSPADIPAEPLIGNGEWGRIGFFYPQNHSNMMNWLLWAIEQRAKELGIPGGPELAVRSSYSTENIISSAFKIANLCDNKKLKGAVILGPSEKECDPSVRENFYDILTHMLEIMLIRCGVINFEEASTPSTYVKILAELLR